jgi:hypothetical protein
MEFPRCLVLSFTLFRMISHEDIGKPVLQLMPGLNATIEATVTRVRANERESCKSQLLPAGKTALAPM